MYQLFEHLPSLHGPVVISPSWNIIRSKYQQEIQSITNYYNERVFYLATNNILVRVLDTFGIPLSYNIDRYADIASTRAPYIAKYFQMTSDISYGKIHHSCFFNKGVSEILLSTEEYFNIFKGVKEWRKLRPVTVLSHPISDLSLLLPDGRDTNTARGIATISIDIPKLMVMYKGYMEELPNGNVATSVFIHEYVLPNMLHSYIELIVMNRLMALYYGMPMTQSLAKHRIGLSDYSARMDKVLLEVLDRLKKRKEDYSFYLDNMPAIYHRNMRSSLYMPDIAKTRQAWWALYMSRLDIMLFLAELSGVEGRQANSYYIGKLKIDTRRMIRENLLKSILPREVYYDVIEDMQAIMKY